MRAVVFVPEPEVWRRERAPGGLSLLERQLKQLRALGCEPPLLLVPATDALPSLPPGSPPVECRRLGGGAGDAFAALAAAEGLPDEFLLLAADRLIDRRVLQALAVHRATILVCVDGASEPVGRVRAADVARYGAALPAHASRLALESMDPYDRELRGVVAPYVCRVRNDAERRRGWDVLLDHVQKRGLDLPGQYLDTPFENFLVRRLAPTRVTPNQITVATTVLAFGVAGVLLHGWLRSAVPLMVLVGILDGVDGKLARLKLATSRLGELEHVADFFYENGWYLAIGLSLRAATASPRPWHAALALGALDLADNLLYGIVRARTGRLIDEITPFDRTFRRIAGRRNVYVLLFAAGFLSGYPAPALLAAAAWAALTVAVHAVRALMVCVPRNARRPAAQASGIEGATAVLMNEK